MPTIFVRKNSLWKRSRSFRLPCVSTLVSLIPIALSVMAIPSMWGATRSAQISFVSVSGDFLLADHRGATPILVETNESETLRAVVKAFADDVQQVAGSQPPLLTSIGAAKSDCDLVIVGVAGESPVLDQLSKAGKIDTSTIAGKWESSITQVVDHPMAGVRRALVIAGSDRRGAAYALFDLSRAMGVSPWTWWADVPVTKHAAIYVGAGRSVHGEPSVKYRGIFLNDEDWGLRPWAAKKMDPELGNIGPHTYEKVFELLLRLRANSLWPAMHPGTLAFNAVPENAKLADKWGIVMGSSHSEALLRNNVGEWDEKRDGPWNYQLNKPAIDAYWDRRIQQNGQFENFYTVGMRGVHDTGLEATGTAEQKARLVEQAMHSQRSILEEHVQKDVTKIPQVIWLYKESLELYRAGMKVPDDVTLGWTDDNYGYLRQLPTVEEQRRPGGSGIYYHVSYWGFPHDYLWLCSTPPALIREEMSKAYDHNARKYWVLNVGDLKPAEIDIDYFLQLASEEPRVAAMSQRSFLEGWAAEQFGAGNAKEIADVLMQYYQLNFIRKPEFMGFNGYDDGINRTAFNPLGWGDQNATRLNVSQHLQTRAIALGKTLPPGAQDAYFELIGYPVQASAAQNIKFLQTDRSFLDVEERRDPAGAATEAHVSYDQIQSLTKQYNSLQEGKWDGIMSSAPRDRQVFRMPKTAERGVDAALPPSWRNGDEHAVVSINAAKFNRKNDGSHAKWTVFSELGVSGASVEYGAPGLLANEPDGASSEASWLEYDFSSTHLGKATLELSLLPTFPVDSAHRLRYAVAVDDAEPIEADAAGSGEWQENSAPVWAENVLRNAAIARFPLGEIASGPHRIRLFYRDPGVVFEHLEIKYERTPPAYPVPPAKELTHDSHQ